MKRKTFMNPLENIFADWNNHHAAGGLALPVLQSHRLISGHPRPYAKRFKTVLAT
jgi:hypothetical protein